MSLVLPSTVGASRALCAYEVKKQFPLNILAFVYYTTNNNIIIIIIIQKQLLKFLCFEKRKNHFLAKRPSFFFSLSFFRTTSEKKQQQLELLQISSEIPLPRLRSFQLLLRSLIGRLPTYFPSISRQARIKS